MHNPPPGTACWDSTAQDKGDNSTVQNKGDNSTVQKTKGTILQLITKGTILLFKTKGTILLFKTDSFSVQNDWNATRLPCNRSVSVNDHTHKNIQNGLLQVSFSWKEIKAVMGKTICSHTGKGKEGTFFFWGGGSLWFKVDLARVSQKKQKQKTKKINTLKKMEDSIGGRGRGWKIGMSNFGQNPSRFVLSINSNVQ